MSFPHGDDENCGARGPSTLRTTVKPAHSTSRGYLTVLNPFAAPFPTVARPTKKQRPPTPPFGSSSLTSVASFVPSKKPDQNERDKKPQRRASRDSSFPSGGCFLLGKSGGTDEKLIFSVTLLFPRVYRKGTKQYAKGRNAM